MGRIIRSEIAQADAIEIWAYIAEDNEQAADQLIARFDAIIRKISTQPGLGKAVDELVPNLRFIPIGSYLIFYRPIENAVEIVRLLHGARDITAEFFRG